MSVSKLYILYEIIYGLRDESEWECIGVSSSRKDLAKLASKRVDLYVFDGDEVSMDREDIIFNVGLCRETKIEISNELGNVEFNYILKTKTLEELKKGVDLNEIIRNH